MNLEEIISGDKIQELEEIDIMFSSRWVELAVEKKAYKCLSYLLDKNTKFSQFCFLRASENNDEKIFRIYENKLKSPQILRECLEICYRNNYYNLFSELLSIYSKEKGVLKNIAKNIFNDPLVNLKKDDYIYLLIVHRLLPGFRGKNKYTEELVISEYGMEKLISKGKKLNLESFIFPSSITLKNKTTKKHYSNTISYYSDVVKFNPPNSFNQTKSNIKTFFSKTTKRIVKYLKNQIFLYLEKNTKYEYTDEYFISEED